MVCALDKRDLKCYIEKISKLRIKSEDSKLS